MASSMAVTYSPKEVGYFEPFVVDWLVIIGAVGSPVVYTTPAPPCVVPAEALPSV